MLLLLLYPSTCMSLINTISLNYEYFYKIIVKLSILVKMLNNLYSMGCNTISQSPETNVFFLHDKCFYIRHGE